MKTTYPTLAPLLYSVLCTFAVSTALAQPNPTTASTAGGTTLHDVSAVNQVFSPNIGTWASGSTVTIMPSDDTDLGQGARVAARTNNKGLQEQNYLLDAQDASSTQNVVALLDRDPTKVIELPAGTRVVIIDTGAVSTLNDFALKSFGAESKVTIDISDNPRQEDAWSNLKTDIPFTSDIPLDVKMQGQSARYIRITFNTAKAGPVGCLHIAGKRNTTRSLDAAIGNSATEAEALFAAQNNPNLATTEEDAIKKVTYLSGGELKDAKNIYDNDFRTTYAFDSGEPAIIIFETNTDKASPPIERIGFLIGGENQSGTIDIYAVDHLPIVNPTLTGTDKAVKIVQLEKDFAKTNMPLVTIPIGKDGRAGTNLAQPTTATYIIAHIKSTTPQTNNLKVAKGAPGDGTGTSVADSFFGPQSNVGNQTNQAQALQNALRTGRGVRPNSVAPQVPAATTVAP